MSGTRRSVVQTIKTGVVVALLLAVCYGAFVALNAPEPELSPELEKWASGSDDEFAEMMDIEIPEFNNGGSSTSAIQISGTKLGSQPSTANIDIAQLPQFGLDGAVAASQNSPTTGISIPSMPTVGLPTLTENNASEESLLTSSVPTNGATPNFPSAEPFAGPSVPFLPAATKLPSENGSNEMLGSNTPLPLLGDSSQFGSFNQQPLNSNATNSLPFELAKQQALQKAGAGQLQEALRLLTAYYENPDLSYEQHTDLVDILDSLALQVIYSKRHLIEPAYTSQLGDTVKQIATDHNITQELLAGINELSSETLVPGTQVKVMHGPFRAEVSLSRSEMTLFLGDLYAGRFPISTGSDPVPSEGSFEIVDRRKDRKYFGLGGNVIDASDPRNPYGGYWLSMGDMCIHGTPSMVSSELEDAGCISLAPLDAKYVYDILAQGCQVKVVH